MPSSDRGALSEVARSRLISVLWLAASVACVSFIVWWGWSGRPSPGKHDSHKPEQHCTYAEEPQPGAKAASKRPPLVVCFERNAAESGAKSEAEGGEQPRDPITLSHLTAWKLISDPVALFTAILAIFTWRLIVVGRDQHTVAIRAIKSSEDSSRREMRAYLATEIAGIGPIGLHQVPVAKVTITNVGQTPAYNVRADVTLQIIETHAPSFDIPRATEPDKIGTTLAAGKGQVTALPYFAMLQQGVDDYVAGTISFAYSGTVYYEDIFGETHKTWFLHIYRHDEPTGRYHQYGNGAD